MSQSNKLKTYIRVDSSGRDIPSTNVLRTKLPVTGRWRELTAYECCSPAISLSATVADTTGTEYFVAILCDGNDAGLFTITGDEAAVTIEDVVALLNDKLSFLGLFSVNLATGDVDLQLTLSIAQGLCPDTADLTLEISVV